MQNFNLSAEIITSLMFVLSNKKKRERKMGELGEFCVRLPCPENVALTTSLKAYCSLSVLTGSDKKKSSLGRRSLFYLFLKRWKTKLFSLYLGFGSDLKN